MASRPQNHVTRDMEARLRRSPDGIPILRNLEDLVVYLNALYPPKCRGADDSERTHERYAGKVELVEHIARIVEQNRMEDLGDEDLPPDLEHV